MIQRDERILILERYFGFFQRMLNNCSNRDENLSSKFIKDVYFG